jgi:hypothetical protein
MKSKIFARLFCGSCISDYLWYSVAKGFLEYHRHTATKTYQSWDPNFTMPNRRKNSIVTMVLLWYLMQVSETRPGMSKMCSFDKLAVWNSFHDLLDGRACRSCGMSVSMSTDFCVCYSQIWLVISPRRFSSRLYRLRYEILSRKCGISHSVRDECMLNACLCTKPSIDYLAARETQRRISC